jgi:hypothetical protein
MVRLLGAGHQKAHVPRLRRLHPRGVRHEIAFCVMDNKMAEYSNVKNIQPANITKCLIADRL